MDGVFVLVFVGIVAILKSNDDTTHHSINCKITRFIALKHLLSARYKRVLIELTGDIFVV